MHEMFDRIVTLRVGEVMTAAPVTIDCSASMQEASRLFSDKRIHAVPVVDHLGHCVGILTASDFVKRADLFAEADARLNPIVHEEQGIMVEPCSFDYVTDCMTQCIQSVAPTTPLISAAKIMIGARLHVLPVIDDHKPVGVLSNLDVVAVLVNAFEEAKRSL